jgi:glucuronosyltransferase
LDEAKDGFIFFSLGSNIRSDFLSNETQKALLAAFSELPQKVLWKFESDNLPGQPPNVRVGKWLPQSDILGQLRGLAQLSDILSTLPVPFNSLE